MDLENISTSLEKWSKDLGFQQISITDIDLKQYEPYYIDWLKKGFNGSMGYLVRNTDKRFAPDKLELGTCRVISARMNYLYEGIQPIKVLENPASGYIARYALGRDYHKVLRTRLAKLAKKMDNAINREGKYRAFTDSAPILEKPLGEKAGLGWIGKNGLLLNKDDGSWFFLGEIYTNLPLPVSDNQSSNECGKCQACINNCPTDAILNNKQIDARKCISYMTIESRDPIPINFREVIGNRIFGCDDCQIYCPANHPSTTTNESDFKPRHKLDSPDLLELFSWTEQTFLEKTRGSAIRRINYAQWKRNLAVALGNGSRTQQVLVALESSRNNAPELAKEHIDWAIKRLRQKPI